MSGNYHDDPEVNSAIIRLLDALCAYERASGNGSDLILLTEHKWEGLLLAQDGKPIQAQPFYLKFIADRIMKLLGL